MKRTRFFVSFDAFSFMSFSGRHVSRDGGGRLHS